MLRTNEMVGAGGPRLIPILFIALLVATGAVAVVYGVATAAGPGSFFTGKLLQTTNNNDTAGSPITQFCENQTSTTGQP